MLCIWGKVGEYRLNQGLYVGRLTQNGWSKVGTRCGVVGGGRATPKKRKKLGWKFWNWAGGGSKNFSFPKWEPECIAEGNAQPLYI